MMGTSSISFMIQEINTIRDECSDGYCNVSMSGSSQYGVSSKDIHVQSDNVLNTSIGEFNTTSEHVYYDLNIS